MGVEISMISAQRGRTRAKPAYFFEDVSEEVTMACNATLSDANTPGKKSLRRNVHNHDVPCNEKLGCVAIRSQNSN